MIDRTIHADCELCQQDGGKVLWRDDRCRVVLVSDSDYDGYCRVIWNSHVKEMTDLSAGDRNHCMQVVLAVESALRQLLNPHKINLASFGNMAPHVHWHVIAREPDDAHFPQSIWGARQRETGRRAHTLTREQLIERLTAALSKLC